MKPFRIMVGAAVVGSSLACSGADLPTEDGVVEGLRAISWNGDSDGSASAALTIPVDGESGMLLTFQAEPGQMVFVDRVTSPSGEVVLDAESDWSSDENRTMAHYAAEVVSFNWPILGTDADLEDGDWTVEVVTTDDGGSYTGGQGLVFEGQLKSDGGFDSGLVHVDLVFVNGADQEDNWVSAIEQAAEIWRDIYANIGVTVEFATYTYDSGDLAAPGFGDAADYVAIADSTAYRSINMVITPEIAGQSDLYGIAGGIPGPLAATGSSAVTVSVAMNAGPDLRFDADEIRLLGETMAHESGHFAGLFHPVEYADGAWDAYDAVDDTPRCSGESNCYSSLADNLMFPFPVCDDTSCDPQQVLTSGQGAVENRYTGVE